MVRSGRLNALIVHIGTHTEDLIFHAGGSTVCMDMPPKAASTSIAGTVSRLHMGLHKLGRGIIHPLVSLGCRVSARCFGLSLIDKRHSGFLTRSRLNRVHVVYPPATSFTSRGLRI